MKRLLCIMATLDAGGAETFLMKVFRTLPSEYKLDFIVSRGNGVYEAEVIKMGGKIYHIPMRTEAPYKTLSNIYKIVKEQRYNNVLKMADTPVGVFDVIAAKLGGAKNVCVRSCNASADESEIRRIIGCFLRPLLNYFTDTKVAPSELAGRFTFGNREMNQCKVQILHNGVDLNIFKYDEQKRNDIRQKFNIQDKYVIGCIGRFDKQKNHTFLLDVFHRVVETNPEAVLVLVGDGAKREELIKQAENLNIMDKVIFAGYQRDVVSFYSAMDVYIQTSFFEGMPNTVIEAQATGLPCVISDTITREANLTGNVKYLSLSEIDEWTDEIIRLKSFHRIDTHLQLAKYGYDIQNVSKEFIHLFFR